MKEYSEKSLQQYCLYELSLDEKQTTNLYWIIDLCFKFLINISRMNTQP